MGPLLSTHLGPFACLIAVDGPRCFSMRIVCGELVKTAPADVIISNRQLNQISLPRLVHLPVCRVVWAGRLFLALRCLISGYFCIIPVRSGIEHFFWNNAAMLRFLACLSGGRRHRFRFSFHHSARFPRCSCCVCSGDAVGDVIGLGWLLASRSAMSPVVLASPFPARPSSSRSSPRSSCRGTGSRRAAYLPRDVVARGVALASWSCLGCGAVPWFICRASVALTVLLLLMRWQTGASCGFL